MLHRILRSVTFFGLLFDIDTHLASQVRAARCSHCSGPLHAANYPRKPRGALVDLPESLSVRRSFSCGHTSCRRRTKPPSLLFMDRRVYLRVSIVLVVALRQQRPDAWSMRLLARTLNMPLSTVQRWLRFWRLHFPCTPRWLALRGRVPLGVCDQCLPADLMRAMGAFEHPGLLYPLIHTLALLAGVSITTLDHLLRGRQSFTQNLLSSA